MPTLLADNIFTQVIHDPLSLYSIIIILDVLVVVGLLTWLVLGRWRRTRTPRNLSRPDDDNTLEGRRLERVLGWALLSSAVIAIALPVYWLREPARQSAAQEGFDDRSVERGAVLFAAEGSDNYNETLSLGCANCHGGDGGGGSATTVVTSSAPECEPPDGGEVDYEALPQCRPQQVTWRAPALNTVFLRYPDTDENNRTGREQIKQILVFGRPGTPMPAWGTAYENVPSTGAKNNQAIEDLLNYLESIQLSSDEAIARNTTDFENLRGTATPAELADRQAAVDEARVQLATLPPDASDQQRADAQDAVDNAVNQLKEIQSLPQQAVTDAEVAVLNAQDQVESADTPEARAAAEAALASAQRDLANAQAWLARTDAATDGQLLFELNCARCHTEGWSYYDPLHPDAAPAPGPAGGGAYGPNLRGSEVTQFPNPVLHQQFVTDGSRYQQPYGESGIGTGRMPGFGAILTEDQIAAIVDYERNL